MNEKILIIDDEEMILEHLALLLTREGFQVRSAINGQAAIDIFKSESFDLVITDIRMPEMDGLEVVRQVKTLDKDAELIILTGFVTSDNAQKAMEDGASHFLTKPLADLNELLIPIRRSLERRKRRLGSGKKEIIPELCWFMVSGCWLLLAGTWLLAAEYQRTIFSYLSCSLFGAGYSQVFRFSADLGRN